MEEAYQGPERRKHVRIHKNFIMNYRDKKNPDIKYDITQMYNISKGGMCFISTHQFPAQTELAIELRTPYLADAVYFDGLVIDSREKVAGLLYEIHLSFRDLNALTLSVLEKIERFSKYGDHESHG